MDAIAEYAAMSLALSSTPMRLHVVSRPSHGDPEILERFRAASRALGQTLSIQSRLDVEDLTIPNQQRAMRNPDAGLVMPSRYEPFGLAALTGMAFGRPVLATNVGGLADLLGDRVRENQLTAKLGGCGLEVREHGYAFGDVARDESNAVAGLEIWRGMLGFAAAMVDPAVRPMIDQRALMAQTRALTDYSAAKMAERYLPLYESLMG